MTTRGCVPAVAGRCAAPITLLMNWNLEAKK
jgi:hypothetical protein